LHFVSLGILEFQNRSRSGYQKRDEGGIAKTLLAFMRRADEGTLSRLMVEATILLAASRQNGTTVLKDAATLYKVDTEAIGQKVKQEQEFAAKARARKEAKPEPNPLPRPRKRPSVPSFEGRRTCRFSFYCSKNRAGRHRFGFSLQPTFPLWLRPPLAGCAAGRRSPFLHLAPFNACGAD
jgi:ParB family chromosome partitioning protein